jgi:host factor-I protein
LPKRPLSAKPAKRLSTCAPSPNVKIRLRGGDTVSGWIEYFDDAMLRLTRDGQPNLFIYKQQIGVITEAAHPRASRPVVRNEESL